MKNPKEIAIESERNRIQKCMEDPTYTAKVNSDRWCATCDSGKPCSCDERDAVKAMRVYYEANRRTMFRKEPKLIGSWGVDMDGLMTGLWEIATKAYREKT